MGLQHRTQMGEANARCQPLVFFFSVSLYSQIYLHTLQHWLPLFPLASPSCLLLWPDEPVYLSVITLELSNPNNKRDSEMCASSVGTKFGVLPPFSSLTPCLHSVPVSISVSCKEIAWQHARLCVFMVQILVPFPVAAKWLPACHHPAWLEVPPPPKCCISGTFSSANED